MPKDYDNHERAFVGSYDYAVFFVKLICGFIINRMEPTEANL